MKLKVKVLIWDFDGTLYEPIPALWQEIREAEYQILAEKLNISHDEAADLFHKNYKKISNSATETIAHLIGCTTAEAAIAFEKYYDRRKYLKRDEKLIEMFDRLKGYTHYILANGVRRNLELALEVLGVPTSTFKQIVTSEVVGTNKPSEAGFRYIMKLTGLTPEEHLMIGDRVEVDLVPAKQLGMKTCLVFSDKKSSFVDISIPTVYSIPLNL